MKMMALFLRPKGANVNDIRNLPIIPNEGDLYKEIKVFGNTFTLRYGYYEERDRHNPLCRPIPIYPDFRENPRYTDEGMPYATEIQDACDHFKSRARRTQDSTCSECAHYKRGEDWIGLCECEARSAARSAERIVVKRE